MVYLVGVQGQGDAIYRVYCYVYSLDNHLNGDEFILLKCSSECSSEWCGVVVKCM